MRVTIFRTVFDKNEKTKHISYWWLDHQVGVSLIVQGTAWRTGLVYVKPLDAQPIEYAVKAVQVLMAMNKVARETGGKEVRIEITCTP